MYQRYRYTVYPRRPGKTKRPANPDGIRMVRRTAHEHDPGDR
jgi:hypothetical protein